jgi:membrane protease YdiL (CAAX protease family)
VHAVDSLVATHSAFEIALALLALLVLPALSLFYGMRAAKERRPDTGKIIGRYLQIMARGWAIAIAVLIGWAIAGRPFEELGLGRPGTAELAAIGFSLLATGLLAYQVTFAFKPSEKDIAGYKRALDAVKLAPRTLKELFVFIPVSITAGVWEELFYRGFLMWFFTPVAGVPGAIAITAVIFGAGHAYQGWKGVARTTAVGALFAAGYVATGSLWWLMILHAAIDIFAGILAWRVYSMHRDR